MIKTQLIHQQSLRNTPPPVAADPARSAGENMPNFIDSSNPPDLELDIGRPDPVIAWAAGEFETAGCVYVWRNTLVKVIYRSAIDFVPQHLFENFGGSFCHVKVGRGNYQLACWQISDLQAIQFLYQIYPLLSPRRQAYVVEKLSNLRTNSGTGIHPGMGVLVLQDASTGEVRRFEAPPSIP